MTEHMKSDSPANNPVATAPRLRQLAGWRWGLAFALTFSVLIIAPTRLIIVRMANSARERRVEQFFVLALAATFLLTWNLAASLSEKWRRRTLPVVFALWVIVLTVGVYIQSGPNSNRLPVALLFAYGMLWVPWLAWIGFQKTSLLRRLTEALVIALGPLLLVSAVTVEAMRGDTTVDFAWTWSPPRDLEMKFPEPTKPAVITTGFDPTPNDFPQFLGASRTGVIESGRRPTNWNEQPPKELWRKQVGPGDSLSGAAKAA